MSFQLFKPNGSNKGHGLGLQFNSKEEVLFLNVIKQNGFNANNKGKFLGGKQVTVALGAHEIGGILAVIDSLKSPLYKTDKATLKPNRRKQEYHHESAKQSLKITFSAYEDKTTGEVKGLSISVLQTVKEGSEKNSYSFWAGVDESYLIEEYLKFVLGHFFSADYAEDKKKRAESLKEGAPKKDRAAEPAKAPAPEKQDDANIDDENPFA
jgi:hypothetical protein